MHPGRLLAFDLTSGKQVHTFTFPRTIAGLGSHLNDFQVAPDGSHLYIADASFFARTPALIVYDVARQQARRLLENHLSVRSEFYTPVVQGRTMEIFGLLSIRPGVDSIALTRDGKYLAYAAVTNRKLFAVPTEALRDENLSARELVQRVAVYGAKTMSDGITFDNAGDIYLSDPEHSAIVMLNPKRKLETLVKSERLLRWPDGFSFGPDGWLYITNSSLHEVLGRTPAQIAAHAPYHVLRIKTGSSAPAGH
jgi:sugar lactone lactonase YvrE